MNGKVMIAVVVMVSSIGVLALTSRENKTSLVVAVTNNPRVETAEAKGWGCGNAADVWLCIALKKRERDQKEWDEKNPKSVRDRASREFEESTSWVDDMAKRNK